MSVQSVKYAYASIKGGAPVPVAIITLAPRAAPADSADATPPASTQQLVLSAKAASEQLLQQNGAALSATGKRVVYAAPQYINMMEKLHLDSSAGGVKLD